MKKLNQGFQFNTYIQIAILTPLFVSTLLLLSFNRIPPENNKFDYKSTFPSIIDPSEASSSFRIRDHISVANYDILYLGYEKDTIMLQHDMDLKGRNVRYSNTYDKYKSYYKAKIQLEVDLSQEIKEDAGLDWDDWDEMILFFEDSLDTETKYYKAYPVIIKNHERKPIIIGHTRDGEQLPLILEAKNKAGKWQAIEEPASYFCGMGINPIILKPQEIIVTGVKIYQGSFETELRLKFKHGETYSRTFRGSINPKQFKHS